MHIVNASARVPITPRNRSSDKTEVSKPTYSKLRFVRRLCDEALPDCQHLHPSSALKANLCMLVRPDPQAILNPRPDRKPLMSQQACDRPGERESVACLTHAGADGSDRRQRGAER